MTADSHEFAGRTVLVTGATKGIGRTTAELLARRGASVLALGRSTDDLACLKAEISCRTIAVDLGDIEATRVSARANLPFDLLVNCAERRPGCKPQPNVTAPHLDSTDSSRPVSANSGRSLTALWDGEIDPERSFLVVQKSSRPCGNSETWALSGARSGQEGISAAFAPLAI
jgi:NAD(P)-dependent dehydrogenase (short-subunit alcohol dehydrogenase family)